MTIRKTRKVARYTDTFIREVRATYQQTTSRPFAIKGPDDVADFVRSILTDNSREHFVALYLDGAHQVVSYSIISIGTANASIVHPREVFQRAILVGATPHHRPQPPLRNSHSERRGPQGHQATEGSRRNPRHQASGSSDRYGLGLPIAQHLKGLSPFWTGNSTGLLKFQPQEFATIRRP
ncbi:MAG: JAB domain-containing protein [Planctomycetaceae bacterium]